MEVNGKLVNSPQVQVLKHVFNEINNQSTDTINMQDLKARPGAPTSGLPPQLV